MKREQKNIMITKASGELVPYSEEKLIQSLLRSGASERTAKSIAEHLKPRLYDGVSTKKIYRWALNLLKESSGNIASRYRLKRAIMELGPSGYPFERFIGEILKIQGYKVKIGEIVEGQCVKHEIDIIAEKDEHHFMAECKFHNQPGNVSDVKIPLYIQARFKDVEAAWLKLPGHGKKFHQGWVVTNTRFTADAIQYGNCAGLKLMGWDYPNGGSIRSLIDELGLYPVTCLTTLTKSEKRHLLDNKIILCREISYNPKVLSDAGIKPSRMKLVQDEAVQLCRESVTHQTKQEIQYGQLH